MQQPKYFLRKLLPWIFIVNLVILPACGLLAGLQGLGRPTQPTATAQPAGETPVSPPTQAPTQTLPLPAPQNPTAVVPATPTVLPPADPPSPTQTPPAPALALQSGSLRYIPAFAHADRGCKWLGVAGQVFDQAGAGAADVVVSVKGTLEGRPFEQMTLTTHESAYGPGGYEIELADHLPAYVQALQIQLFDLQGQALSEPLSFILPNSCEANLILVTFGDY